jgi:putative heme-binding domain-containing protein
MYLQRCTHLIALFGLPLFLGLSTASPTEETDRTAVAVEALLRLKEVDLNQNPKLKDAVLKLLEKTRGTPNFVKLVQQFQLADQNAGLLEVAIQHPASDTGVEAMRLIMTSRDLAPLEGVLQGSNVIAAVKTAEVLGNTADNETTKLLLPIVSDTKRDWALRKQAVRSLTQTHEGATAVLQLAKEEQLDGDLKLTASAELNRVRWPDIKAEAAKLLTPVQGLNTQPLPSVSELLRIKGDTANGARVFFSPTAGCANCHRVKGQGIDLGPDLSEIGTKLAREALFEAILNPSAGISFGYEAWQLELTSGNEAYGLIVSDTADEIAIKAVGGIVTRYKKTDVRKREQMKLSIMPAGLQQTMTTQELVDLVEYLISLKKSSEN